MTVEHVQGKKVGDVMLYALSTCGWCRKTRELLQELGVDYSYEYVDLLQSPGREEVLKTIARWNQSGSFPTIVLNNKKCIVGYNPDEIKQELAGG
ncbi:MAG: glutaredoxin family protein [Dehalococcoidales bacterium]|nr:glutaredoxin family protein [Dehalococcoidales bacterium]